MRIWRLRRQLSQAVAARDAGVHRQTWRAWERNDWVPEEYNHVGIERALRWQPGSVAAILAGGGPTPDEDVEARPDKFEETLRQIEGLTDRERKAALALYHALKDEPDIADERRKQSGT